jgi:hypothetical protein
MQLLPRDLTSGKNLAKQKISRTLGGWIDVGDETPLRIAVVFLEVQSRGRGGLVVPWEAAEGAVPRCVYSVLRHDEPH